eukprot:CAMPEP_0198583246 /NCGR_PEP_ID=MMETSP1462-20131121/126516_1 /TAXON_ID=1333877 /ORGANISM="Brandtodinium nutriculum, Strain RCC3387" /LENGTH=65 /DNA_ID=CAMNT_0044314657 /DNA_START=153 /DNA_END=350 /DNA_ORIENTATION=+
MPTEPWNAWTCTGWSLGKLLRKTDTVSSSASLECTTSGKPKDTAKRACLAKTSTMRDRLSAYCAS